MKLAVIQDNAVVTVLPDAQDGFSLGDDWDAVLVLADADPVEVGMPLDAIAL